MENEKVLRGVARVYYGAFGGITPFPVCLKSVSDYLGDELEYTFAIVASGGAFRLTWDTAGWNGGNVDISHTYDDFEIPFRNGITALGREFRMLWRDDNAWGHPGNGTKEDFKTFITTQIDAGKPVISLGPIGPAEAGILTGYRNGGDTLLGWSFFQWDEKTFDEDGYFVTDQWWDESEFVGAMSLGDVVAPRADETVIVRNAIAGLEGRTDGRYAKGIVAYDAWKKALLGAGESDFARDDDEGMAMGQTLMMMCQGDATDCLIDGRKNASLYFRSLADIHPEQPLYVEIAEQFGLVARLIYEKIYGLLGGHERGREQTRALEQIETRQKIGEIIDEMKAADEKTLALLKRL
jgi:hypothetical protein